MIYDSFERSPKSEPNQLGNLETAPERPSFALGKFELPEEGTYTIRYDGFRFAYSSEGGKRYLTITSEHKTP